MEEGRAEQERGDEELTDAGSVQEQLAIADLSDGAEHVQEQMWPPIDDPNDGEAVTNLRLRQLTEAVEALTQRVHALENPLVTV